MVWDAMGLLDDAIREHLELKRLGGADPSEVIRQEQEALGPALRGDDATHGEYEGDSEERSAARQGQIPDRVAPHPDKDLRGQETVELDMRAILGVESSDHEPHAKPAAPAPMRISASSRASASGGRITGAFSEWGLSDENDADLSRSHREGSPIGRHQILDARGPQSGDAGIQESPAQHV
jgi:hypothetical protein